MIYLRIKQKFDSQNSINDFYNSLYKDIEDLIGQTIFKADSFSKLNERKYLITEYFHPINYYGANLKYYKKQLEKTSELKLQLEKLFALLL